MKNLLIEVDDAYHHKVKVHAVVKGLTIKEYIMGLIEKDLKTKKEQTQ